MVFLKLPQAVSLHHLVEDLIDVLGQSYKKKKLEIEHINKSAPLSSQLTNIAILDSLSVVTDICAVENLFQ